MAGMDSSGSESLGSVSSADSTEPETLRKSVDVAIIGEQFPGRLERGLGR